MLDYLFYFSLIVIVLLAYPPTGRILNIFLVKMRVFLIIKLNEITHYIFLKIAQSPRAKKVMRDDYYKYDKSEEED